MSLFLELADFFIPAIFTFILKDYFDLFLNNKYFKCYQYCFWLLYFVTDLYLSDRFNFNGVINLIYSFLLLLFYVSLIYSDNIKQKFFLVLFISCIGAVSEVVTAIGIQAIFGNINDSNLLLFGSACSKIIILIFIRLIRYFKMVNVRNAAYTNWLANLFIAIGSLYIIYCLYLFTIKQSEVLRAFGATVILLLIDVITFKMFDKISEDADVRKTNELYKQRIHLLKKEIADREENIVQIRKFKHDINNHFIIIQELAKQNNYKRLNEYISKISKADNILNVYSETGNPLVDALLGCKIEIIKKYHVDFSCFSKIPTDLPFEYVDLCVILGNALDNAIAATCLCTEEKRSIALYIKYTQYNLAIRIENTYIPKSLSIDKKHHSLLTTKSNKFEHGYGINLMKESVEKYKGLFNIEYDEFKFKLKILLFSGDFSE